MLGFRVGLVENRARFTTFRFTPIKRHPMTNEQFEQLYRLAESDRTMTEKLKRVGSKEEYMAVVQDFFRSHGHNLSDADIVARFKARGAAGSGSRELSDAELEGVAGGCGTCWGTAPSLSDW